MVAEKIRIEKLVLLFVQYSLVLSILPSFPNSQKLNDFEKGSQILFGLIFPFFPIETPTKTCSYWFIFFSNETHTSCLVENTIPQAVSIEKDRRTIRTGDAGVFLVRYPKIQKKTCIACSNCYFVLFYSNSLWYSILY